MRSGFPHSDIAGSKLYCQLPRAFRRLTRPSSPVIAKASTTCTSSLDPITLDPSLERPGLRTKRASCAARARRADTRHPNQCNHTPGTTHRLDALYPLLPIVKEPSKSCLAVRLQVYAVRSLRTPETSPARDNALRGGAGRDRTDDLRLAKPPLSQLSYSPVRAPSNPTPPCQHLLARSSCLVGLVGFEPTTPALSRRCSNQLSYRPGLEADALQSAMNDR